MRKIALTLMGGVAIVAVTACSTPPTIPAPAAVAVAPDPQVLDDQPAVAVTPMLASSASTQPADPPLPSGHPDIAELIKSRHAQQNKAASLPAGQTQLPAGQPQLPGAQPQLPTGHPDVSQMQRPASTQPASSGSIRIRAVQGTANGPKIGSLPVSVDLYQDDQPINKMQAKLDEQGALTLENIPLAGAVQPLVRVTYNGVEYSATGSVMDGQHPQQQIQLPVYETSEEQPAWQVTMQHVMLQPTTEGVQVMEMLAVQNPTDRAWIGKLGPDNKRATVAFSIPAGAANVQFAGGFHDCCTKVQDGQIINGMPLVPGATQYRVVYTLPVSAGKASFNMTTSAATQHLMVFVPNDGSVVAAEGIESGGVANMGKNETRYYKALNVAAGKQIKLDISGITATAAASTSGGAAMKSSPSMAKSIAAAGGLAIFVVGGMFLLRKGPSSAKKH